MKLRLPRQMAVILGLAVAELAWATPPSGWLVAGNAPGNYTYAVDAATPVSGSRSASIAAKPIATSNGFGTLMQMIAADDYRGSRLRLSGYLRTANADRSQMWMRVDGPNHAVLAFDNMDSRPVTGTTEWTQYDVVLDVPSNSVDVAFGFFLAGRGEVWGADFQLEKVGTAVPVTAGGPVLPRRPTNLNFETAAAQGNVQATQSAGFAPPIPAGNGRLFVYQLGPTPDAKIELNGMIVGSAGAYTYRVGFIDEPPGNYTFTVVHGESSAMTTTMGGMSQLQVNPETAHALTFHLSSGQVRYIRLDAPKSYFFVGQVYPKLVDEAVGRAQIDKAER